MKRRGVCVSPASSLYTPTFRESTLISAKRLGFSAVRFNPGVAHLVENTQRGDVVPEVNWAIFDAHFQRCKQLGLDVVLTMVPPDSGMATGWQSTRVSSPNRFSFNSGDTLALSNLYSQIVGRALVANAFPASRLFVEIANEASLAADGGVYSGVSGAPNTGEIQPQYLAALGAIAANLKAYFPDVCLITHAFAYDSPGLVVDMLNPWTTEFGFFAGPPSEPPAHLLTCDIVNVHIYYGLKLRFRIQTSDEYRARTVALFDQFVSMLRQQRGAEWDVVTRKPIWITETGVSYNFAGMDYEGAEEAGVTKWGNSIELSTFRVMTYDALSNHPDAEAAFYYTIRNELVDYDARDHAFNEGILLKGDADLPIYATPSYTLFGYSNSVAEPELPLDYAPAPEPAIA